MKQLIIFIFLASTQTLSGATISGTVIEISTGDPVLFATVKISIHDKLIAETESDFNGEFIIANLPNKKLTIEISFIGLAILKDKINFKKRNVIDEVYYLEETEWSDELIICVCRPLVDLNIRNQPSMTDYNIKLVHDNSKEGDSIHFGKTPFSNFENKGLNFTIYPNPTTDYINIKNDDKYDKALILDIRGTVKESVVLENSSQHKIDLTNYFEGSYILQLFKEDELIKTEKIVFDRL
jgi:hypothetical protein